jgi:hypothetical protein
MATATRRSNATPLLPIRLKAAWVCSARKTFGFKPLKPAYHDRTVGRIAGIHSIGRSRLVHAGEDLVVVTDGSWGYMPFSISGLRALLTAVEKQPIEYVFRVDR